MPARRTILIMPPEPEDGEQQAPFGACRSLLELLRTHNIAPDGSGPEGMGETPGMGVLYGPGMVAEIAAPDPKADITQFMVTLIDEDFAWPVLLRMCKAHGWRLVDPESGRTFG